MIENDFNSVIANIHEVEKIKSEIKNPHYTTQQFTYLYKLHHLHWIRYYSYICKNQLYYCMLHLHDNYLCHQYIRLRLEYQKNFEREGNLDIVVSAAG